MAALGPIQMVLMVGVLTLLSSALGRVTIKRDTLFENTIRKWNVNIRDKRDYSERLARFERSVEAVERTTSGILLESLNSFTVMNDNEWESIALPLIKRSITPMSDISREKVNKRSTNLPKELPREFTYWEEVVGLSPVRNQMDCGACWSFPDTGTIEALNAHLTGDRAEFSQQYFVDCTFPFSGCAGGSVTQGYKTTMMRQFMVAYKDHPFTGAYTECKFKDDIENMRNNAMDKIWIQDYLPLEKTEEGLLRGLLTSPVSVALLISEDLYSYSGGDFTDENCAVTAKSHAMLLVGYTENTLRVKASYGVIFGDDGYIDYKRDVLALTACNFFNQAYALYATYRRDLEYKYCNDRKATTRQGCEDSCQAMNTDTESGWSLAVIPTQYHNEIVTQLLNNDFPGKHNVFWIGLEGVGDGFKKLEWVDGFTPANYLNVTYSQLGKRYGLIQQEDGKWITKGSTTYVTRGLCSRAINCWNIENAVKGGSVKFSNPNRAEGTVATVECANDGKVLGASQLKCVGGRWDADLPECSEPELKLRKLPVPQPAETNTLSMSQETDTHGNSEEGHKKKGGKKKGKHSNEDDEEGSAEQTSGRRRKHRGEQHETGSTETGSTETDTDQHTKRRKGKGKHH